MESEKLSLAAHIKVGTVRDTKSVSRRSMAHLARQTMWWCSDWVISQQRKRRQKASKYSTHADHRLRFSESWNIGIPRKCRRRAKENSK
jgi:hypothetical protein